MGGIFCRFCGKEKGVNAHLCEDLAQAIVVMKKYGLTWEDYDEYCKD